MVARTGPHHVQLQLLAFVATDPVLDLNRSAPSMMLTLHALCASQWVAIGGEWMCQAGRQADSQSAACMMLGGVAVYYLCIYRIWLPTYLRAVLASDVHNYRVGAQQLAQVYQLYASG